MKFSANTDIYQINGAYIQQPSFINEHPFFKHDENDLVLYFHSGRRSWVIADTTTSSSPYAFVEDDVATPGEVFFVDFTLLPT